jgi:hypothetical protein
LNTLKKERETRHREEKERNLGINRQIKGENERE